MANKKIIITAAEKAKLEEEIRYLIDVEKPKNTAALQLARSQGDLSENADFDAARETEGRIEKRIQEIEYIFNNCEVVDSASEGDAVGYGDTVTLKDEETGEQFKVVVVGSTGANPMADLPAVSNESPLGKALLGKKKGSVVTVESEVPYAVKIVGIDRK